MREQVTLTTTSLVSILLMTFHLADDILLKMSPAGFSNLIALVIFVVWLYGTLVLAGHRAGYIIVLLGSLFGLAVTVIHMNGSGGVLGGEISQSSEAFFFVWTLLALGATSAFSAVLAAQALWRLPWRRTR